MQPMKTILRLPEVMVKTGLSRSTIYAAMAQGSFPLQIQLSARAVGWYEAEIDAWLDEQASRRDVV